MKKFADLVEAQQQQAGYKPSPQTMDFDLTRNLDYDDFIKLELVEKLDQTINSKWDEWEKSRASDTVENRFLALQNRDDLK